MKFSSEKETVDFVRSLKAVGVEARTVGNVVGLSNDSFFGLLAATNAAPPGFTLLYRSDEGDFRLYASADGGRMRFYFAVKHGDVWRAVEGLYSGRDIMLICAERDV